MSEEKLKSLLEQIDILAMNLDSFAAVISGLIESIRESGVPEETITRFENLSKALSEQKKDLGEIGSKVSDMVNEVTRELEEKKAKIDELEKSMASKDNEINELKTKLSELSGTIDKLKSELDQKTNRISDLEKELEAYKTREEEYKNKIQTLESELDSTKKKLEEKDIEISKIKAELNDAKKKIAELEGSLSEREARISDLRTKLQSMEEEIKKIKEDFEAKISELNKTIEERNIEITNLKNQIGSLEKTIEEKDKKIAEAKEVIARYEKEVAAVEFARSLVATHPDAHILRALPVMLSIGVESEGYICADQTKFMMHTKKTFHAIKPLLERVFKPEWFKFLSGIPPRLCVRKDILESIRIIFEG